MSLTTKWLFQNVDIISDSDDAIAAMITQMKEAVEVKMDSLNIFVWLCSQ